MNRFTYRRFLFSMISIFGTIIFLLLSPCLYADDTQGTSAADLGLTELTDDLS